MSDSNSQNHQQFIENAKKDRQISTSSSSTTPRSPRAPPLISKFRGEPPPSYPSVKSADSHRKPLNGSECLFAATARPNRPSFYVIHPEWASEAADVSRLSPRMTASVSTTREDVRKRTPREIQGSSMTSRGEEVRGILPVDRGDESMFSVARRAAAHNPVWPHRCKSSPPQRSRDPIAWV
ncbi:unnamed protein product [Hydatigera taeniaeformis]|uniref:Uncharacterized protein n=1 Tax=Hydatigena taeniaeformis TaxID=6205 RepID=A0A0R3X4A6_HYDTA|nr:unnamed protein product [Hydatigera taeniaeformis]